MIFDAEAFRALAHEHYGCVSDCNAAQELSEALECAVEETERLRVSLTEKEALIDRIRIHAQKMAEWKGAVDPFGPLHGAGMARCANAEGRVMLRILSGEKIVYPGSLT